MNSSVFANPSEISGQRPERLHQAAGQRLAATGIAAGFAASLAILVCSVGDALAAAPTVQVDVVNPATNPALTRNVDGPGRIAYQSEVACLSIEAVGECAFEFPAVPKNHRLVVQHVSVALSTAATGAQATLEGGANNAFSSFAAPPSFQSQILFDQPVLQYIDAGSAPLLNAFADLTLTSGSASISGYLLDCATTPCAVIAQ